MASAAIQLVEPVYAVSCVLTLSSADPCSSLPADVEALCERMDKAGIPLEAIDIQPLSPAAVAAALMPTASATFVAPDASSSSASSSPSSSPPSCHVLLALQFKGMSLWQYPGDASLKGLFRQATLA